MEELWEKVQFWSVWALVSEAFEGYSFSCIMLDWKAPAV